MNLKIIDDLRKKLAFYKKVHSNVISPEIEQYWEKWIKSYFIDIPEENSRNAKRCFEKDAHLLQKERSRLSTKYLHGDGIEIGALNQPLTIPDSAHIRYVDRLSNELLSIHYPELRDYKLANVDIIDDGEKLESFNDQSLNFIICNHFLEHCQNPLRAIEACMRVLQKGGILYCAIPDKRYTFDLERSITPFSHVLRDYQEGPEWSRSGHYIEWSNIINRKTGIEHEAWWRFLEVVEYSIHFHVWSEWEMLEMFLKTRTILGKQFDIREFCMNISECIFILEKT